MNRINAVIRSEAACRSDLADCRAKTPPPAKASGLDPATTYAVAAGVVVAALALGFGAGYLTSKLAP